MSHVSRSESVEMYLKTLAELSRGAEPVAIARIAERLGVTQVSANEMMQRLAKQSLVAHTPYKGVTLTRDGRGLALDVIRRQRLWECFLADHLKLDWTRLYELACDLEHATAPDVAEALDAFLDHPATCPHGNPIPSAAGKMETLDGVPLDTVPVGQTARILAIQEGSAEVLEYLHKRDVLPGRIVTVTEAAPLQGPLTLQLGDTEVALGLNLASIVLVEPLP
jgi:DtxR family Mn-dependent transcriptional regulator